LLGLVLLLLGLAKTVEPRSSADGSSFSRPLHLAAFFAFALSGTASMAYEVVWTRALAMALGSSIYAFALILETFLVGIALGSAAMSALFERGSSPIWGIAWGSAFLCLLGHLPWALDFGKPPASHEGSIFAWLLLSGVSALAIFGIAFFAIRRLKLERLMGANEDFTRPSLLILAFPIAIALFNFTFFTGAYLPKILSSVLFSVAFFFGAALLLRSAPALLLAVTQLLIAVFTFVSAFWQDEIPYAFAQLVVALPDLAEQVGRVQAFMFVTAMLCTLPSTLGMGATFPIALRIWNRGGSKVPHDLGVLYAGNTIGSIVGSWLPGFVLLPLIGIERTLHAGIGLNMLIALAVLIAGASDEKPTFNQPSHHQATSSPPTSRSPKWQELLTYFLAPAIPALFALFWVASSRPPFRWNQAQMTLGVFRMAIAEGSIDPKSWGQPEIVYYKDGLTTTVSVERWGYHLALKNNGKVDASNGDDMPTQINVAAYPILLHSREPEELDIAVIGFGSGVSVGTALNFPVRSVEAIELERSILEASAFFSDVSGLNYPLPRFPFVQEGRLRVINDDARNYLASTTKSYDIIVSEPSNPWITGVSDLFTINHFRVAKK
ncbi:MAG: hypothetical protein N2515_07850, partial [Deltaproteobacteria bacterium]|nr:hypothetical protein [Deltaproteobacteria bacterium]